METVDKEFGKLKNFDFKKVEYKGCNYLALEPFSISFNPLLNKPINRYVFEIEPFIIHHKKLLETFYDLVKKTYVEDQKYFIDSNDKKRSLVSGAFTEIKSIANRLQLIFSIPNRDKFYLSYYLITDLLHEIEQRLSLLSDLELRYKPYLFFNKDIVTYVYSTEVYETTTKLDEIELINIADWFLITLNRGTHPKLPTNESSSMMIDELDDVLRPEAKVLFEKLYMKFCLEDLDRDLLDIVLFFKAIYKRNYFSRKLSTEDLYLIARNKTNREISYNYFKNRGAKELEIWLEDKPEIPEFK